MKVKELMRMLHGLEDFELKDCALTTEILEALDAKSIVRGRWIDMGDHVMCSVCGCCHYGADKNYCPNCGVRMDEHG